jgi:hypothetical protein
MEKENSLHSMNSVDGHFSYITSVSCPTASLTASKILVPDILRAQ